MVRNKYHVNNSQKSDGENPKAISSIIGQNEFEGLIGFEEISTCTLLSKTRFGNVKRTVLKDGKIVKKKRRRSKKKRDALAKKEQNEKNKQDKKKKKGKLIEITDVINKSSTVKKETKKKDSKLKKAVKSLKTSIASKDQSNSVQISGFMVTDLEDSTKKAGKGILKRKNQTIQSELGDKTASKRARYDKPKCYSTKSHKPTEEVDLSVWRDIFTPEPVIKSLAGLGFLQPTEIQRLTLPAAIKGRKDIIGAAETGSGKTLAFGIPIIHGILKDLEIELQKVIDSGIENSDDESETCYDEANLKLADDKVELVNADDYSNFREDDNNSDASEILEDDFNSDASEILKDECNEDNSNSDASEILEDECNEDDSNSDASEILEDEFNEDPNKIGCVKVIDNANFDFLEDSGITPIAENVKPAKPLRALIVTPTRELAIQIKGHLDAVLGHTSLKTAVVVGGVAQAKQERLLRRGPEIVVGTPGRLWELIQLCNPHLSQVVNIRYLVIDETDRMIERGHFQELQDLLELINSDEAAKAKRQTFVFSATLTMVHSAPKRITVKNKAHKINSQMKIENLAKLIGVKQKPKIVDVTRSFGTAASLTEARINCTKEEKDLYLFYFLKRYPGRTLVFCNSIDCVRRLQNLFTLLKCQPQSIHASMHQKQRLKSLERFSDDPRALLLATDVAARGLDIPNIQHVIHYQVPRTAETYVHRSGRTARACQEGLSILLIEPSEVIKYRQLCTTLNRADHLPPFPTDFELMKQVKERVILARTVEKMEHTLRKSRVEANWWKTQAEAAEIILDEDYIDEEYDGSKNHNSAKKRQDLKTQRAILHMLLSKSMIPSNFSGRYPTHTGTLITPAQYNTNITLNKESKPEMTALTVMKKEKDSFSDLLSKVKFKAPVKKISKKKYKGFEKRKLKLKKEKEAYRKQMEKDDYE